LGRLAACYMDSLASLEIPAIGYGIRYEFGIFDQEIKDGWQVEITDKWLQFGNPWELARPEAAVNVKLGGYTESYQDDHGNYHARWIPRQVLRGIPYDTPILGYKVTTANTLRLWKAEAAESFDFQRFNVGDYYGAVNEKVASENLTKVL
ncbi:MAG: glycogen/starch/alpha-glucan phosphorylase, partial [Microcystaceae cyanobacterium]